MKKTLFLAMAFMILIGGVMAAQTATSADVTQTTEPVLTTANTGGDRAIAEAWIKESQTYKVKGSGLAFVKEENNAYTFTFTAKDSGLGTLSSRVGITGGNKNVIVKAKQVTRTIVVTVKEGKVASAIIDGAWDEIGQKYVTKYVYKPGASTPSKVAVNTGFQASNAKDRDRNRAVALSWFKNTPTYTSDGFDLNFVDWKTDSLNTKKVIVILDFKTKHTGYGKKATYALSQVTAHRAEVGILDGKVVSAIIDDKWDEQNQKDLSDNQRVGLITMKYQPVQCKATPWQDWYSLKNNRNRFHTTPTDEALITAYYTSAYSIQVTNVNKVASGEVTCNACGSCPTPYYFVTQAKAREEVKLKNQGWTKA